MTDDAARRLAERQAAQQAARDAMAAASRQVADCGLCDDDGYRGRNVCDHIDRSQTAKRGIELVRAALAKGTPA